MIIVHMYIRNLVHSFHKILIEWVWYGGWGFCPQCLPAPSLSSLRLRTYIMMKILIRLLKSLNRPHTSNSNHMTITRLHAAGLIFPRTFINFYINCTKKNYYYSNKMVDVGGVLVFVFTLYIL